MSLYEPIADKGDGLFLILLLLTSLFASFIIIAC
jgi:hypothetical protein